MKWKTYKNLKSELQKEYDYRFRDDVTFKINGLLSWVSMLAAILVIMLFCIYLVFKEPALIQYKEEISHYVSLLGRIIFVTTWIVVIYILEYLVRIIIRLYNYNKWKKENKIVIKKWWHRWLIK
jgi:membrane protein YdbS with pleckstrin-like domain